MIDKLKGWKKILAAVIGAALNVFGDQLGLSSDSVEEITKLLMAYLVGQGIADARR